MDRGSGWTCPSQPDEMRKFENTYAFNHLFKASDPEPPSQTRDSSGEVQKTSWAWDNFGSRPGLSGFMGPWTGPSYTLAQRIYPHAPSKSSPGYLRVCVDGSVEYFAIE
jgi:hypothetical protein